MGDSIVLEEDIDPNYVPTEEELYEYAESLGLRIPEDNDLLYLAREGLKARLPKEWKPCQAKDDQIFYFNFETGESVWEHPCDTLYKKKIKEAKEAKKMRLDKSKPKGLTHSKKMGPLSISPVMEQPENPEFIKRKKELEEEFLKYSEELKKEITEKKNQLLRQFQAEIEEKKEKLRKNQTEKEEVLMKGSKMKLEQSKTYLKKQLEKEENDAILKEKGQLEANVRVAENWYFRSLEEEKLKSMKKVQKDVEVKLNEIKKSQDIELEGLKNEVKYLKQKKDSEFLDAEAFKDKHHERLKKLREKVEDELLSERKTVDKEIDRQLWGIKQEENGELGTDDLTLLYNLEKELSSAHNKLISEIKAENLLSLTREKEKVLERAKSKTKKIQLDMDLVIKEELALKEKELKKDLKDSIEPYKYKKQSEYDTEIDEYKTKLARYLTSEEQQASFRKKSSTLKEEEKKTELETQIRSTQKEIANIEHLLYLKSIELDEHRDEENKLRTEIHRQEIENKDLQVHDYRIENVVVADLEKQLNERESEIAKFSESESDRLKSLENEVQGLKKLLYGPKNPDTEKLKLALANEKEELKRIQSTLKLDRDKWNKEMREYKANPTERKRIELYNIKKIIEKNINKHNLRVKELKQAEEMIRPDEDMGGSEDEELLMEMWRNTDVKPNVHTEGGYSRQPWQNHNLHVYQRQVNKWSKNREYMKDVMLRHGSWLNNMKEQLNRVMSTPHSIKSFY